MVNIEAYQLIKTKLAETDTQLVAVSKFKPVSDIQILYDQGQRAFGENYVQELEEKIAALPDDIEWHFIGNLQRNKVKYIAEHVNMIQSVDSLRLLSEIQKQAKKFNRIIDCLLQIHIAVEDTKFGLDEKEVIELMEYISAAPQDYDHIRIRGVMGMASFVEDEAQLQNEFKSLKAVYINLQKMHFMHDFNFNTISMGMSNDYELAISCGSNMVRVGSALFGNR